jgi:hypothetical protein
MRRTILFSIFLLAVVACETAFEPFAPDGAVLKSLQSTAPGSHVATVLPDGILGGEAVLVVDDEGGVFGSIKPSRAMQAARWAVDASGNVSGPVLLGTLPAPFNKADQYVRSASRNGNVVLGYAADGRTTAGWAWTQTTGMTMLPAPGNQRIYPLATNDAGVIVGQVQATVDGVSGDWGAVWFPPYDAQPILLPRMQGYGLNSARGITNEGLITGWVRGSGMVDILVEWRIDAGGHVLSGPVQLDGIDQILMSAANEDRDVVGSFHGNDRWEPYLFRSAAGQHIELGLLAGYASGSARGVANRSMDGSVQAVGSGWTRSTSDGRAVLWSVNAGGTVAGPMDLGLPAAMVIRTRPLRTAEFVSAGASSINSQGWVVGWSQRGDGTFFATLWRPNST